MTPLEEEIMNLRDGEELSFRRSDVCQWLVIVRSQSVGKSKASVSKVLTDTQVSGFAGPDGMIAQAARKAGKELDETPIAQVLPTRKNKKAPDPH